MSLYHDINCLEQQYLFTNPSINNDLGNNLKISHISSLYERFGITPSMDFKASNEKNTLVITCSQVWNEEFIKETSKFRTIIEPIENVNRI